MNRVMPQLWESLQQPGCSTATAAISRPSPNLPASPLRPPRRPGGKLSDLAAPRRRPVWLIVPQLRGLRALWSFRSQSNWDRHPNSSCGGRPQTSYARKVQNAPMTWVQPISWQPAAAVLRLESDLRERVDREDHSAHQPGVWQAWESDYNAAFFLRLNGPQRPGSSGATRQVTQAAVLWV